MAKLNNSISNNTTGRIGASVYYKMFGKQYVRNRPNPSAVPPSQAQLDQQYGVFKNAMAFIQFLKFLCAFIFPSPVSGRSKYSQFAKQMFPAFGGTQASPTMDLTLAVVGNGDIPRKNFASITPAAGVKLEVTWDPTVSVPQENGTDKVYALAIPDEGMPLYFDLQATRSTGSAEITFSDIWIGEKVTLSEIIFKNATTSQYSKFAIKGNLNAVTLLT